MAKLRRAVHIVTHRPTGYTFKGKLFGLSAGSWIVTRKVAEQLCNHHGFDLPRVGYDRMLDETGYNYVSNEAGRFRVSLRCENYDHAPTGTFA